MRWLRLLVSNALGRHKLGHQCTVLGLFAKQTEDPKQQVLMEEARTIEVK